MKKSLFFMFSLIGCMIMASCSKNEKETDINISGVETTSIKASKLAIVFKDDEYCKVYYSFPLKQYLYLMPDGTGDFNGNKVLYQMDENSVTMFSIKFDVLKDGTLVSWLKNDRGEEQLSPYTFVYQTTIYKK